MHFECLKANQIDLTYVTKKNDLAYVSSKKKDQTNNKNTLFLISI